MKFKKLKYFNINGLFGTQDVHITFDHNIKILIGENGIGKTQVLNIFYYTLTRNFLKLIDFPFESIKLKIGRRVLSFSKQDLKECYGNIHHPLIKKIIQTIGISKFEELRNQIIHRSPHFGRRLLNEHHSYRKLRHIAPTEYIIDVLREENFGLSRKKDTNKLSPKIEEYAEIIKEFLNNDIIMYFPTFRRVEEDLHNLGYDEDELLFSKGDTKLIHFGMDDVQKRFNAIEKRIDLLLKEGFTKISSEILSQLIKGFGNTNKEILNRISKNDIEIILARVGSQISELDKKRIREIVKRRKIAETDNSLIYFLQILIDIYEKQKEFDMSIKEFRKVCNKYLLGKKVFYDESNIKIYIKSDSSEKPLKLNKLSSGEKQIISIFSKIYLSDVDKRFIILFDEPELSLSMTWQKQLLPDILNSKKCDFLLAVTHSPFIFDNELDNYALGLNEYVKPL